MVFFVDLEGEFEFLMYLFKNKEFFIGIVKFVECIVGFNVIGEICYIVIEYNGDMFYWEG